ncbi:photosystem II manganese-stabilizing polypeptide [Gloeocapsa sp. PCC 73106]|uniref:photosystem II manganese-stabilizing polypeptide n=1 Tax=Gloeocapsa sp. PCC 73106 TaxID=102232 RepID=UPI0002AC36E0|nr:photosystem II manganese-stabilizing polypeptide [Gloeocapsa sp. PCC 73106]ELR98080.1 Manganese-stabilising protein / photosystem II polypeptide [Gloeocapsa sp. PCC 73106]
MRYRALITTILAICFGLISACSSDAPETTVFNREGLTYDQIVNTGLANKCPQLAETARGSLPIASNDTFVFEELCMEPQEYAVKEEASGNKRKAAEFIAAKALTRYTSSLEQINGKIKVGDNGVLTLIEESGIDFQPVTVQLPGGEQVPFLFTVKQLVATTEPGFTSINTSTNFKGEFNVPSYRGNVFLDPKGRGVASGYENAVALPSQADSEKFIGSNIKQLDKGKGEISLAITKVDNQTGEVAGIFESVQPSDTDLGAQEPLEVKIRGTFYARVRTADA